MPKDSALNADHCMFMEAVRGYGGVHNANNPWWLDIKLTGATRNYGGDSASSSLSFQAPR
jgi:hypothetical protein